ncbi:MAG: hypothetical protein SGI77_10590 [Pirellulaceae bacterium]|nr:hypothetical protein [Pirellulaceae bacterium]
MSDFFVTETKFAVNRRLTHKGEIDELWRLDFDNAYDKFLGSLSTTPISPTTKFENFEGERIYSRQHVLGVESDYGRTEVRPVLTAHYKVTASKGAIEPDTVNIQDWSFQKLPYPPRPLKAKGRDENYIERKMAKEAKRTKGAKNPSSLP